VWWAVILLAIGVVAVGQALHYGVTYAASDLRLLCIWAKHHVAIGVSVPEVVPDWTVNLAKCWSEWQDLNLRPPRPERGVRSRTL
jgi:hypothetical protein